MLGDVVVVTPEEGATFSGSSGTVSIKVSWTDNGAYPPLEKFTMYTFVLEYGPNLQIVPVANLKKNVSPSDITVDDDGTYSYTVTFPSDTAGNGQFYIQVYAVDGSEGNTIHYSPRFFLTSMAGGTSFTYSDTIQPVGQTAINTDTAQASASIDTRSFTVPYTMQTGISRFAPMQMQPGSTMTATTWTRKFATSAVTYYSTFRTSLDQLTTLTPGWSYTLPSGINMATPAAYPTNNGGWYSPKEKQTLSTRKVNLQNRLSGSSSGSSSSSSSSSSS